MTEIVASLASIPERAGALDQTVRSLAPHVDRLQVSLNDYKDIPRFLARYPHLEPTLRAGANRGDGEKFAAIDDAEGYVLVCDDDLIAAGAYKAARALGLDVPGDLSITGFDDVLLATALEPELTTVRLPAEELGAQGMTALLDLLAGERPEPRVLPGELVVRDSTAPPGEGGDKGRRV